MVRTLSANLLTAQESGYPATNVVQPAVRCILTSKDGGTTYDYSFDPTATDNRLLHVQQIEGRESDKGVILLSNSDRTLPDDLTGFYVDLGWGLNTSAGIKWAEADGCVTPRLWIMDQLDTSGAPQGQTPQIFKTYSLAGIWSILNTLKVRIGTAPYYQDDSGTLVGQTIYGVLTVLIETHLTNQTGYTFLLDSLASSGGDDGLIDSIVPFPAGCYAEPRTTKPLFEINDQYGGPRIGESQLGDPGGNQTYADIIHALLAQTHCYLKALPYNTSDTSLHFEIKYPQATDAADLTYNSYSPHYFYEIDGKKILSGSPGSPNHIRVYGKTDPLSDTWDLTGDWYDPAHFSTPPTYDGPFMEALEEQFLDFLDDQTKVDDWATVLGEKMLAEKIGSRLLIPMDARTEIYDRVKVYDARGY